MHLEDSKLIFLLINEPEQGIRESIIAYGALVKMLSMNILGAENKGDIEECVADTFVKLWKSIQAFDPDKGKLKNFIAGIARHTALDCYRKLYKSRDILPLEEQTLEFFVDMAEETERRNNEIVIKEVVNELKEPDREIFIRRYFYYESIKSIAEKLELDVKKIENTLYRGKKKLQEKLIERGVIRYE